MDFVIWKTLNASGGCEAADTARVKIELSALPKDTTSKLPSLFSALSLCAECQAAKLQILFFKSFGMTPLGE